MSEANLSFLSACEHGSLDTLAEQLFGDAGAGAQLDLNCTEKVDGNTGLILAVRENREEVVRFSAANRLIGEVVQSRRRPLLGPSPG